MAVTRPLFCCALAVILWFAALCPAQDSQRQKGEWWIANMGVVTAKENPQILRAQSVFRKVLGAADRRANRPPRMIVVRGKGEPYAEALQDGSIIVTLKAIQICFEKTDTTTGDSRLAFILGHELAHLARDDFWHQAAFSAIEKYSDDAQQEELLKLLQETTDAGKTPKTEETRMKELQADGYAIFYMTIAGFQPSTLFGTKQNDLFDLWFDKTRQGSAFSNESHPSAASRREFIRTQIQSMIQEADLYVIATRFYQLGRYEDSIPLLMTVLEKYPGRDVFNNLGLCYYLMALQALSTCDEKLAYRFRLPVILAAAHLEELEEVQNDLTLTLRGSEQSACYLNEIFAGNVERAVFYFERARAVAPTFVPATLNLASTFLLSAQYSRALSILDEGLAQHPDQFLLQSNKAIALYLFGQAEGIDTYSQTREILNRIINTGSDGLAEALHNAAVIETEQGHQEQASEYWRLFLQQEQTGVYADRARRRLKMSAMASARTGARKSFPLSPVPIGPVDGKTADILATLPDRPFVLRGATGRSYSKKDLRVVTLNNHVELVEITSTPEIRTYQEVVKRWGQPVRSLLYVDGKVLIYKGILVDLLPGNRVGRICFFQDSAL